MKDKRKFICPCCGRPLRYEEWVAMRQQYRVWYRQLLEGKGRSVKQVKLY